MKHTTLAPVVKSADRALDILEYVADAYEPVSFSQLMQGVGIPRSSLFHLLNNLKRRGYLEQEESSALYSLGPSVRHLAERFKSPPLSTLVVPAINKLRSELDETCGFYILVGDVVETIASSRSTQALTYHMNVGDQAPLYAISGGKAFLAHMEEQDLEAYLARTTFESFTPQTITSITKLREEIDAIRSDGFAYSREEFALGLTGIALVVEDNETVIGAVNLAVPTARFTRERDLVFRRLLRSTAAAIVTLVRSQASIQSRSPEPRPLKKNRRIPAR